MIDTTRKYATQPCCKTSVLLNKTEQNFMIYTNPVLIAELQDTAKQI